MNSENIVSRHRMREVDRSNAVRTLLNSLTLDNVREAAFQLSPTKKVRIRSQASSYEDLLQVKQPTDKIIQTLLQIEAQTPFKHVLVARMQEPVSAHNLKAKLRETISVGGFDFLIRFFLHVGDYVYLTLEHIIIVREWVEGESADIRKVEQYETRHPLVVRTCLKTGISLISFPGFTQGSARKRSEVINYGDLLTAAVNALSVIGLITKPLPIRDSLKVLLAGPNRRVFRIRADVEEVNVGRFDLSSLKQHKTVEEALADLILPHLGSLTSREAFIDSTKRALNSAEANFLILYWAEEAVLTRLKFWDIGCEMFFTWHSERASYRAIDGILQLLSETEERLADNTHKKQGITLNWLSKLPGGHVIRPSTMAETLSITGAEARQALVYGVKAGLLIPVYRLNTTQIVEGTLNDWVDEPSVLRRSWTLSDDSKLDGSIPSNVEVAFRRAESVGGQK